MPAPDRPTWPHIQHTMPAPDHPTWPHLKHTPHNPEVYDTANNGCVEYSDPHNTTTGNNHEVGVKFSLPRAPLPQRRAVVWL